MKPTSASLLVAMLLSLFTQLPAQRNIRVEATSDDISYALDLRAVASLFGETRNLEEFEQQLNNYENNISNLDLNSDGYLDYLRVIETAENNVHLVVIQAVLGEDFYQDVATIVVEKDRSNRFYVQIIGDPFMYGYDYIIEPYYYRTPFIVNWFWSSRYYRWNSPYYWGYYPHYYHYRHPLDINIYLGNIHHHINSSHRYNYSNHYRNENVMRYRNSIGRNDYGVKHPDRTFENRNRNEGYRNKHDFSSRQNDANTNRNGYQMNGGGSSNTNRNNTYENR